MADSSSWSLSDLGFISDDLDLLVVDVDDLIISTWEIIYPSDDEVDDAFSFDDDYDDDVSVDCKELDLNVNGGLGHSLSPSSSSSSPICLDANDPIAVDDDDVCDDLVVKYDSSNDLSIDETDDVGGDDECKVVDLNVHCDLGHPQFCLDNDIVIDDDDVVLYESSDETYEEDEDDDGYEYEYHLDDELVPKSVSDRFGRERLRKRACPRLNKSSRLDHHRYNRPGCVHGKHGLGVKHSLI